MSQRPSFLLTPVVQLPCVKNVKFTRELALSSVSFNLFNHKWVSPKNLTVSNKNTHSILVYLNWLREIWQKMIKKKYIFVLKVPIPLLTLLLSDLQPQMTLTQEVMTSSSDKEVRWPQQSLEDDCQSKDRKLWNAGLKEIYYPTGSWAWFSANLRVNKTIFYK